MNIYLIAGEASGDLYGAKIIKACKKLSSTEIKFNGIGGGKMQEVGFKSLFDMSEISLMGFLEIIPHLRNLLKRIDETAYDIVDKNPEILLTIDSPGFCCEVVKKIRFGDSLMGKILRKILFIKNRKIDTTNLRTKFIHYVAPTVWAYKPKRVFKFKKLFDHLMVILPFEPEYFQDVGLPCTYVGHPIIETAFPENTHFRKKYNIANDKKLITIMAGSRKGEIKKLLPIFLGSVKLLSKEHDIQVAIATISNVKNEVSKIADKYKIDAIITDNHNEKLELFKESDFAIVKSGTGSFEVALAGCPMVIAYKVNKITAFLVRIMIKIRFANLINIVADSEIIPEFIQENCKANLIAERVNRLLNNDYQLQEQLRKTNQMLDWLGVEEKLTPSERVANFILKSNAREATSQMNQSKL